MRVSVVKLPRPVGLVVEAFLRVFFRRHVV